MSDTTVTIPEWLKGANGREIEFHCPQKTDDATGYIGTRGLGTLVIKLHDDGLGTAEIWVRTKHEVGDLGNLSIRHIPRERRIPSSPITQKLKPHERASILI